MNIGVIVNEDKDINFEYTKKVLKFIIKKDVCPLLDIGLKDKIKEEKCEYLEQDEIFTRADFIIILGGDGTILRWCIDIAKYKKNILGINMGTLGYLADVEKKDGIQAIEKVIKNEYSVEKRMMLSIEISGKKYYALNEVNINNGPLSKMVKIGIDINGQFVDAFRADGIIISTPTGSTAYNLSAGGPILKPNTELIAITYVCPHALFSRPYVISSEDKICTYLTEKGSEAYLAIDGKKPIFINCEDKIYIKKAPLQTNIIKTTNLSFYDILRRKMFEIRK